LLSDDDFEVPDEWEAMAAVAAMMLLRFTVGRAMEAPHSLADRTRTEA
jgi:hypothetical protein